MNARLAPVDLDTLPDYPIPVGERLESHSWFGFHYDRWLNSDFFMLTRSTGDRDVQAIALELWCRSQDQDPVGTLPTNTRLLAALLGMSVDVWEGYLRRDPSPLYGWSRCRVQPTGEIRLMHKVVTEITQDAYDTRAKAADRAAAERERKAIVRLRDNVASIAGDRLADDRRYIIRLHLWLDAEYPTGNRTITRIVAGMEALGTRDLKL
ncbi:hypothetical protein [Pseudooceanicola sp.]|uniref:hypothetical protein n=1 Tax=Pseudooceanicola sp. TaxID=1914328 RepID=UPI004059FE8A